jgi:hypothetical protein
MPRKKGKRNPAQRDLFESRIADIERFANHAAADE